MLWMKRCTFNLRLELPSRSVSNCFLVPNGGGFLLSIDDVAQFSSSRRVSRSSSRATSVDMASYSIVLVFTVEDKSRRSKSTNAFFSSRFSYEISMSKLSAVLANSFMSSLVKTSMNESFLSAYDYLYDTDDNSKNNSASSNSPSPFGASAPDSQHLASILHHLLLFSKMSDNQSSSRTGSGSSAFGSWVTDPASFLSLEGFIPSASLPNTAHSYRFLSLISLWFVLIVNPIVVSSRDSLHLPWPRSSLDSLWCNR